MTDPHSPFDWQFLSHPESPDGSFRAPGVDRVNRLYFPLFNLSGMMSAVTPDLKGDLKTGQHSFLLEPQVSESLLSTSSSRNFWIRTRENAVWSATGVSAEETALRAAEKKPADSEVRAGPGYFTVVRKNAGLGLEAETTLFVPPDAPVEIALVAIRNRSRNPVSFTATAAIPLYGRSADNLRDHRQVTTLLNRVSKNENGLLLTPTLLFDESGHKPCPHTYSAHAFTEEGVPLSGVVADLESFIGEGGSLDAPEMIYKDRAFQDPGSLDGRQAVAALRFPETRIEPGRSARFVWVLGIHDRKAPVMKTVARFASVDKAGSALSATRRFWRRQAKRLVVHSGNPDFDNWMTWVSLQPVMRRVFGCSFLPDFGYGRGGRGWRDLWQDCLGMLLTHPREARSILLNNIRGVRIDGSNATIIGYGPGEFIADRNNLPRTWMDHGVWPLWVVDFYIRQSGDLDILRQKRPFFYDGFSHRTRKRDPRWENGADTLLRDRRGRTVRAEILLHLAVQNLTQFYNRGDNGNIRLEDADWNDGLDMAPDRGESVPFTAMYAGNLEILADLIALLRERNIVSFRWPEELETLVRPDPAHEIFQDPRALRSLLDTYFERTRLGVSGRRAEFSCQELERLFRAMSVSLKKHIRKNEFIKVGPHAFYNGYYDNRGRRVEGVFNNSVRMSLTAQVFPILSRTATLAESKKAFRAASKLLKDRKHGGFRLNTDYRDPLCDLGRAFSFSYGDKENGGFFSHMNVMFANALYRRGLAREAYSVIDSIFGMCRRTENSLIFPGLPEYFNGRGRGLYCYITGSAAWLVMTLVTECFGIRGDLGDLVLAPRLASAQFGEKEEIGIETRFHGKPIRVRYRNPERLDFPRYRIAAVRVNGRRIGFEPAEKGVRIPRGTLQRLRAPLDFTVDLSR
jgi:cellobiose phosphorylase